MAVYAVLGFGVFLVALWVLEDRSRDRMMDRLALARSARSIKRSGAVIGRGF